jgi:mannose-6-phosphate isomerase-like protein (cupin superfamily)
MTILTTGETLDDDGNPIPGTGFEYESDGKVADLLSKRITPLLYSPSQREWAWMVPDESNGEIERGVAVSPAGNEGPVPHYHPTFDEHFKASSGSWILKANEDQVTLNAGEDLLVKRGTVHTFRCVGEDGDFGVMEFDVIPAMGFGDMLKEGMGLQHDLKIKPDRPDFPFLQNMVSLRGYRTSMGQSYPEIMIPVPPGKNVMTILNILSFIIAPIGRLLGYKANDPRYYEDEFWEKRVNQPPK